MHQYLSSYATEVFTLCLSICIFTVFVTELKQAVAQEVRLCACRQLSLKRVEFGHNTSYMLRPVGRVGFEGVRSNPPFGPQ